jgi:hypothetical protein
VCVCVCVCVRTGEACMRSYIIVRFSVKLSSAPTAISIIIQLGDCRHWVLPIATKLNTEAQVFKSLGALQGGVADGADGKKAEEEKAKEEEAPKEPELPATPVVQVHGRRTAHEVIRRSASLPCFFPPPLRW